MRGRETRIEIRADGSVSIRTSGSALLVGRWWFIVVLRGRPLTLSALKWRLSVRGVAYVLGRVLAALAIAVLVRGG
jgi:hypothetical protein